IFELSRLYPDAEIITIHHEDFSDFMTLAETDAAIRVLEREGDDGLEVVGFKKWETINDRDQKVFVGDYEIKLHKKFENTYNEIAQRIDMEDVTVKIEFQDDVITLYESIISKPRAGSENSEIFSLLYKHPNVSFTKKDLAEKISTDITKPFSKIVENLGFTDILRDVFFSVSKDQIMFKNPATVSIKTAIDMDGHRYKYKKSS
ncbi:hypothetical protein KAZ57_02270, partial [Patescibacteria group bacterium]|nr:hypothetical protein [Patescibacteria group bacterium]